MNPISREHPLISDDPTKLLHGFPGWSSDLWRRGPFADDKNMLTRCGNSVAATLVVYACLNESSVSSGFAFGTLDL